MITKWKEISREVLHSEKLANSEMKPAEHPRTHRQWSKFSDSEEPPAKRPAKKLRKRKAAQE